MPSGADSLSTREVIMYKKQLGFQKFVCMFAVCVSVIWFIYSLGMITDIHDALRFTIRDAAHPENSKVAGSILYYDMQPFNKLFLEVSIALVLLSCLLYLTNTHSRRKYYVGNYVATILYSVASVATIIWSHIHINAFKWQFLNTVDFEALKEQSEMFSNIVYTESTALLDAHLLVAALALLATAGLVANMFWKMSVMRGEQELINTGKEATV